MSMWILTFTLIVHIHSEFISSVSGNSDQVIAYRRYIKETNLNHINELNSQRNGQTYYPYPEFIEHTIEEIAEMHSNKQLGKMSIGGLEFPIEPRKHVQENLIETLKNNTSRFVNNTLFTGAPKKQGKCGSCYSFASNSVVNYATNAIYKPANRSTPADFRLAS